MLRRFTSGMLLTVQCTYVGNLIISQCVKTPGIDKYDVNVILFQNYKDTTPDFDIHMSAHRNIIPNYSQQDATFLEFIYFYRRSTCFRRLPAATVEEMELTPN